MPKPLSVNSVIDKNKIVSGAVWVVMLDIEIVDPNTREVVDTLYIVKNNEDVVYQGHVYKAGNFDINLDQRQNSAPTVSITAQDQTGYIEARMEAMAGGVFSNVHLSIVNTQRLDLEPEMRETFQILSSGCKNHVVSFDLGAENFLNIRFPKHSQRQDRCAWRYRGYGCGYVGSMPSCDYTKDGANGCKAHGNLARFRAIPGLIRMNN